VIALAVIALAVIALVAIPFAVIAFAVIALATLALLGLPEIAGALAIVHPATLVLAVELVVGRLDDHRTLVRVETYSASKPSSVNHPPQPATDTKSGTAANRNARFMVRH
jgi:hypothetical protein